MVEDKGSYTFISVRRQPTTQGILPVSLSLSSEAFSSLPTSGALPLFLFPSQQRNVSLQQQQRLPLSQQ
jgi:hypothetical protein